MCFYDNRTVANLLVDFRKTGGGNPVPTSVENTLRPVQAGPMEHLSGTPHRVVRVSDNQTVSEPRQSDNQESQKVSQHQNTTRRDEGFCK